MTNTDNNFMISVIVSSSQAKNESWGKNFSLNISFIRANQGHLISVDVELDEVESPDKLWHGTSIKSVASINELGLVVGAILTFTVTLVPLIWNDWVAEIVFVFSYGWRWSNGLWEREGLKIWLIQYEYGKY